ncbi:unnamed protein product [Natator depressus]
MLPVSKWFPHPSPNTISSSSTARVLSMQGRHKSFPPITDTLKVKSSVPCLLSQGLTCGRNWERLQEFLAPSPVLISSQVAPSSLPPLGSIGNSLWAGYKSLKLTEVPCTP